MSCCHPHPQARFEFMTMDRIFGSASTVDARYGHFYHVGGDQNNLFVNKTYVNSSSGGRQISIPSSQKQKQIKIPPQHLRPSTRLVSQRRTTTPLPGTTHPVILEPVQTSFRNSRSGPRRPTQMRRPFAGSLDMRAMARRPSHGALLISVQLDRPIHLDL